MTFKTIVAVLLSSIVLLSSCASQSSASDGKGGVSTDTMGQVVTQLDTRIWALFQDSDENYWFGSNANGVYRYDGVTLIQYTEKDGLIDNHIRGLQEDALGNVFIETPSGVSKFDGSSFTNLNLSLSPLHEWKSEPNDLWFHCNGNPNHVYRWDGEQLYELALPEQDLESAFGLKVEGLSLAGMNSSPYSVFGIDKDTDGNLWFGTIEAGAFRYDGTDFQWFGEKDLTTLPDGRVPGVRSMIQDKDGNYWLSNMLHRYKVNSITDYEKLPGIDTSLAAGELTLPYFMSAVRDTDNGSLWMLTFSQGIWNYDGVDLTNYRIKDGEKDILLISVYKDKYGVLWLGTDNAGVYRWEGVGFEKFQP